MLKQLAGALRHRSRSNYQAQGLKLSKHFRRALTQGRDLRPVEAQCGHRPHRSVGTYKKMQAKKFGSRYLLR
jgi:hypothetical protein